MKSMLCLVPLATAALFHLPSCATPGQVDDRQAGGMTEIQRNADPETRAATDREVVRRQQAIEGARQLIAEGDRMNSNGDTEAAIEAYQKSLKKLP